MPNYFRFSYFLITRDEPIFDWRIKKPPEGGFLRERPRAWVAERYAQVKEEPATRAEDTEQKALPPRLTVLLGARHFAFHTLHIEVHTAQELVVGDRILGQEFFASVVF